MVAPAQMTFAGAIKTSNSRFGFIKQDTGEPDMFVMPAECKGFGGQLPPVGTRVMYTIGADPQKGQPRAEDVFPEDENTEVMMQLGSTPRAANASLLPEGTFAGAVKKNHGSFGFILQDNGREDMFLMPAQCQAFGGICPAVGTRVVYSVVVDGKTGKPRAEEVQPEEAFLATATSSMHDPPDIVGSLLAAGLSSGTIKQNSGRFGFILQDSGEADMFVMPVQCQAFGGVCPPVGTSVLYTVATDPKTGKPRAENVQLNEAFKACTPAMAQSDCQVPSQANRVLQAALGGTSVDKFAGMVKLNNSKFGFILQDNGEADMFVMPVQCQAFGGECPPVGTRVVYEVVVDGKTGRPRAENVQPEEAYLAAAQFESSSPAPGLTTGVERAGTIKQHSSRFGFILQDTGEPDMFFMPAQCTGFGGECPPVGARVIYEVGIDGKSGRPRAEDVRPEHTGPIVCQRRREECRRPYSNPTLSDT